MNGDGKEVVFKKDLMNMMKKFWIIKNDKKAFSETMKFVKKYDLFENDEIFISNIKNKKIKNVKNTDGYKYLTIQLSEELKSARKTIDIILPLINKENMEMLLSELYDLRKFKKEDKK